MKFMNHSFPERPSRTARRFNIGNACEAFVLAALLTLSLRAGAGEQQTLSLHRSRTALELSWHGVTLSADGSVQRPYFELQRSVDLQHWQPIGQRLQAAATEPN